MNIVDSSGWLEYFSDGPNASFFAPTIENVQKLIVPALCLYEVYKKLLQETKNVELALELTGQMNQATIVELSTEIALDAAELSIEHKMPMADSIILATAKKQKAVIWTQDSDFANHPDVKYVKKR